MSYNAIAFSDAAEKLQEKAGSRSAYARMEKQDISDVLSGNEKTFISERDSFYMSTMGSNGFPYIQHRGGPRGFLKVLGDRKLGFLDFRGNMQYISLGNLATNNKVALILVDYTTKTRLKIYAEAEVVELKDDPALLATLSLGDYKAKPERMIVLHVNAYSWNCPQHIVPRFTLEEIQTAFEPQQEYIARLESEIKSLKASMPK